METTAAPDRSPASLLLASDVAVATGRLGRWMILALAAPTVAALVAGASLVARLLGREWIEGQAGALPFAPVDPLGALWCLWLWLLASAVLRKPPSPGLIGSIAVALFLTAASGLIVLIVGGILGTDPILFVGPFRVPRVAAQGNSPKALAIAGLGLAQLAFEVAVGFWAWRIARRLKREAIAEGAEPRKGGSILGRQAMIVSTVIGIVFIVTQLAAISSWVIEGNPTFLNAVLSLDRMIPRSPFRSGRGGAGRQASDTIQEAMRLQATGRYREAKETYQKGLERYREIEKQRPLSVAAQARVAHGSNNLAWLLATCPDLSLRDPVAAVTLAEAAVALIPENGTFWNTLGAARYRAHDWDGALAAFQQSLKFRHGGDAYDWYFLALLDFQLGRREQAREWYDKAVEWTKTSPVRGDPELRLLRAEVADKLGLPAPPFPGEPVEAPDPGAEASTAREAPRNGFPPQ